MTSSDPGPYYPDVPTSLSGVVGTYRPWAEAWAPGWSQNHPAELADLAPLGLARQGQRKRDGCHVGEHVPNLAREVSPSDNELDRILKKAPPLPPLDQKW